MYNIYNDDVIILPVCATPLFTSHICPRSLLLTWIMTPYLATCIASTSGRKKKRDKKIHTYVSSESEDESQKENVNTKRRREEVSSDEEVPAGTPARFKNCLKPKIQDANSSTKSSVERKKSVS